MRGEYPGQSEAGSRKRKTPSPQPPGVTEKEDITGLGLTPKVRFLILETHMNCEVLMMG